MKIITLWQPYASLIAMGLKQYETRGWYTNYRGNLLIHSAKKPLEEGRKWIFERTIKGTEFEGMNPDDLPMGCLVAIASLADCLQMTYAEDIKKNEIDVIQIPDEELAVGDWRQGRYAWKLQDVRPIPTPIPASGKQGLWNPYGNMLAQLVDQMGLL